MSIILIRHGETPLNRARILQPPDTPLSDLGLAQAGAMAQRLSAEPIDRIVSSDMTRAAQTAAALGEALNLPVQHTDVLHERSFGDLRGKKFSELGFDPMAPDYAPPNGESWPAFYERVSRAFDYVIEQALQSEQTLAVVSHGLVIREMIRRHLQSDAPPERLENTSVTMFDRRAPYAVSLLACDAHLLDLDHPDKPAQPGGLV